MKMKSLSTSAEIKNFFGIQPLRWGSIKVTRVCNLRCRHCYVSPAGKTCISDELTTAEVLKVIDEFERLGCSSLFLNGGEPYLRKDIFKLYEYASKKGLKVSTSSNGYNFTPSMMRKLSKLNPQLFQVSIDGLEKTHDEIRGVEGSYRKATNTLALAREYLPSRTNIVMASTIMADNYDDIPKLFDVAKNLKVNTYCLIPIMPSVKTSEAKDVSTADKYKLFMSVIKHHQKFYTKNFDLSLIVPPGVISGRFRQTKYGYGYKCSFPDMLGVDSNGDIAPCEGFLENLEFKLGNIRGKSLEASLDHSQMQKVLSVDYRNFTGVCGNCRFIESCRGGCRVLAYQRNGNFLSSDPLCQDFYDCGYFPEENLVLKTSKIKGVT